MITNVLDHDLRQSSGDLFHSQHVGELVIAVVKELRDHSTCHDRSKTESTEVQVFDEFTPKLKTSTYGSEEYKGYLEAMGELADAGAKGFGMGLVQVGAATVQLIVHGN